MSDKKIDKKFEKLNQKEIEVVNGNGKNLDISPVYDHVIIDTAPSKEKKKNIIIPKEKKDTKD